VTSPLLQLRGVRKDYRRPEGGAHTVIDIAHFALRAGEETALSGESGCGKTTLLNLIAGILRPDSGSIELAGQNVAALSEAGRDRVRANHLGYIFQTFNLLQGYTALENVLLGMSFGPGEDRDRASSLLQRVGLGDRLHHRPRQLSSGQQQRVAIARALANRPQLVLADEPTGNLDAANAREVLQLIRSACSESNAALLIVSHDPGVLAQFENAHDLRLLNQAFGRRTEETA